MWHYLSKDNQVIFQNILSWKKNKLDLFLNNFIRLVKNFVSSKHQSLSMDFHLDSFIFLFVQVLKQYCMKNQKHGVPYYTTSYEIDTVIRSTVQDPLSLSMATRTHRVPIDFVSGWYRISIERKRLKNRAEVSVKEFVCIILVVRCTLNVWVIVASLCRVQTVTADTDGIQPLFVKSLQGVT